MLQTPADPAVTKRPSKGAQAYRILGAMAVLLALALGNATWAIDPMPFKDRAEEVRFQELARELRCLQCQNQTLADSEADIARQLREEIFRMMREGQDNDQIKAFMTARYGDFVLYKPPVKGGTWGLWFGAFVILAAAAVASRVGGARRRAAGGQGRAAQDDGSEQVSLA